MNCEAVPASCRADVCNGLGCPDGYTAVASSPEGASCTCVCVREGARGLSGGLREAMPALAKWLRGDDRLY